MGCSSIFFTSTCGLLWEGISHISLKKSRLQLNTHAYIRSSKDEQIRLHTKTIGTHVGYLTSQKAFMQGLFIFYVLILFYLLESPFIQTVMSVP